MTKSDFKSIVKTKMRTHVLEELNSIKISHSKVMGNEHKDLKYPQKYLINSRFSNKQSILLINLRCKSPNGFASNFASSSHIIPCKICKKKENTQEHAIHVRYSDLFSSVAFICKMCAKYKKKNWK